MTTRIETGKITRVRQGQVGRVVTYESERGGSTGFEIRAEQVKNAGSLKPGEPITTTIKNGVIIQATVRGLPIMDAEKRRQQIAAAADLDGPEEPLPPSRGLIGTAMRGIQRALAKT